MGIAVSSHLSRGQGKLRGFADCVVCRRPLLSVVIRRNLSTFQTTSNLEPLGKFYIQRVSGTIIRRNFLRQYDRNAHICFQHINTTPALKLCMQHWVLGKYQIFSNDDLWSLVDILWQGHSCIGNRRRLWCEGQSFPLTKNVTTVPAT